MNLDTNCDHCGANPGSLCKASCEVNGEKIKVLRSALVDLGLSLPMVRPDYKKLLAEANPVTKGLMAENTRLKSAIVRRDIRALADMADEFKDFEA